VGLDWMGEVAWHVAARVYVVREEQRRDPCGVTHSQWWWQGTTAVRTVEEQRGDGGDEVR
jgi:hypothetical protein